MEDTSNKIVITGKDGSDGYWVIPEIDGGYVKLGFIVGAKLPFNDLEGFQQKIIDNIRKHKDLIFE